MNIVKLLGKGFNKTTADTFSQKRGEKTHTFHITQISFQENFWHSIPLHLSIKAKVAQGLPFPKFINAFCVHI